MSSTVVECAYLARPIVAADQVVRQRLLVLAQGFLKKRRWTKTDPMIQALSDAGVLEQFVAMASADTGQTLTMGMVETIIVSECANRLKKPKGGK